MRNPKQIWFPDHLMDELNLRRAWVELRLAWGVPSTQTIDQFVCDEIEGRGHKFVRAHRNIEARY